MTSGMPNLNLMFGQRLADIRAGNFDNDSTETETSTTTSKESSEHDKAIARRSLAYGNNILNGCYGKNSPINNLYGSSSSYSSSSSLSSLGNLFNNTDSSSLGNLFNNSANVSSGGNSILNWLAELIGVKLA